VLRLGRIRWGATQVVLLEVCGDGVSLQGVGVRLGVCLCTGKKHMLPSVCRQCDVGPQVVGMMSVVAPGCGCWTGCAHACRLKSAQLQAACVAACNA
jgi:hypothetical protein